MTRPGNRSIASTLRKCGVGYGIPAAFSLILAIALSYGDSLSAIWTLDDFPNILQNPRVHAESLDPETLRKALYAPQPPDSGVPKRINRPLAYLSFALNWYIGHDQPEGYRLVNIFLHCANACLLLLVIRAVLNAPRNQGRFAGREDYIAFLGAALWALNPIQSQAVVYIVQRMASLACMFYLLALWGYLRLRKSGKGPSRAGYLLLVVASYIFGLASKENAVLLPAALVLIEACFFQNLQDPRVKRIIRLGLVCGVAAVLAAAGWLFHQADAEMLLGYGGRNFTAWERLLTQPRVIWFYLGQIFYPMPDRLSIVHDVDLSISLFRPWTTLPALLALLAAAGIGIAWIRSHPVAAFAILFFLLNHVVESSAIGLEMVFEHRNYLPSLFLFLPVSIGIRSLDERCRRKGGAFRLVVPVSAGLAVFAFGVGTHTRTLAWADAKTFWEDAARKAPGSMRPLHNLAYEHYEKRRQYRDAFELYHKSLTLKDHNRKGLAIAHSNIANFHYRSGDLEQALVHLDRAVSAAPEIDHIQYFHAVVLLRAGRSLEARKTAEQLLGRHPGSERYSILMAHILLQQGDTEETLFHLRRCLADMPESAEAHAMLAIALVLNGNRELAMGELGHALARNPSDKRLLLWRIHLGLSGPDPSTANGYASQFMHGLTARQVEQAIAHALSDGLMPTEAQEWLTKWMLAQAVKSAGSASEALR
jgi:tetratricopeptide (TPR) repeat protein